MNTMHTLLGGWDYLVLAALATIAVVVLLWTVADGLTPEHPSIHEDWAVER